jgi:hypothetical protein
MSLSLRVGEVEVRVHDHEVIHIHGVIRVIRRHDKVDVGRRDTVVGFERIVLEYERHIVQKGILETERQ